MFRFILILTLLGFVTGQFAQQFNVKNFTTKDGLTSSNVNCVCQDQEGYIWFATQNGVCRYDGNQIKSVELDASILSIDATFIMEDSQSRIWVGTTNYGAYYIENGQVRNLSVEEGLPNNWVNSIYEDSQGRVWLATDEGPGYFVNGKLERLMDKDSLLSDAIYCVSQTEDNRLWFGTVNRGLVGYKDDQTFHFTADDHGISNMIYSLTPVGNELIVGTADSGAYYLSDQFVKKFVDPYLSGAWISKSLRTSEGIDFITSSGLVHFSQVDSSYSYVFYENGLVSNDLYSGFYDHIGNLWLSSGGNGVSVLVREDIRSFRKEDGLSSDQLSCALQIREGVILLGTSGSGINLILNGQELGGVMSDPLLNDQINVMHYDDKSDEVWIGGGGYSEGIIVLKSNTEGQYSVSRVIKDIQGVDINSITNIQEDVLGNKYISTYGMGLFILSKTDTIRYSETNLLPSNDILDLIVDHNNRVWLSIYNHGVYLLMDGELISVNEMAGLKELNVECITEGSNDVIFFGNKTEGLTWVSSDLQISGGERDKLLSDHVTDLEVEGEFLWVGTDKGVNRIKFSDSQEITEILGITTSSGLVGDEIMKNGLIVDDGVLWVATSEGLSRVEIEDLNIERAKSHVVITGLKLFFNEIDWNSFSEVELNRYDQPTRLVLPYNENHLTFEFSTLSISKQKYSFKLEGWDDEWSPYSENNTAVYSNLQPGTYVFMVKSVDNFGTESSETLQVEVIINPPFWSTWWFRTLVVLFVVGVIYIFFRLRTAALKKRQKELEQTVEERTREVVEEKKEVEKQKHLVEEKNQEISDSINYAERIQRSMLANKALMDDYFNEYFVFFQPKDVVSGDFYWASEVGEGKLAVVNADSTGHGVPGAIMSMLNMNSLKESVKQGITEPNEILNETRKIIKETLMNDGSAEGGKDGMDCSLIIYEKESNTIRFAAANNPVWVVRGEELIEFKGDKMPVGKHDRDLEPFTSQEVELQKGDMVYTLTDGMPDQFGGPKGKKYLYKRMKNFLVSISTLEMEEQRKKLSDELHEWMKDEEQIDDICIIGVRFQ